MGSEARAEAGEHQVTEGALLAPVLTGLGWLQPAGMGTCGVCLPRHRGELLLPPRRRQEGWGLCPPIHGIDRTQHDVTGRNTSLEPGVAAGFVKGEARSIWSQQPPIPLPPWGAHAHSLGFRPAPSCLAPNPRACVPAMPDGPSLFLHAPSQAGRQCHHLHQAFLYPPLPQEVGAPSILEYSCPDRIFIHRTVFLTKQ